MSWGEPDCYNQPENFGLTPIGTLWDPEACYSFKYLCAWKHEDGRIFWAQDSGCSCPSPFDWATKLDDLNQIVTWDDWFKFEKAVNEHAIPYSHYRKEFDTVDYSDEDWAELKAAKTQLLQKVANATCLSKPM